MSIPVPKLAAIGFQQQSRGPVLQHFEALYIYGVLCQLARFSTLQYKDLATIGERLQADGTLSYDDGLKKLHQICQSSRTQYLLTGVLTPAIPGPEGPGEVKITFRLYEAKGNRYIVDEVTHLALDHAGSPASMVVELAAFNRLINQTAGLIIRAIFGDQAPFGNAPHSQSLQAMRLVLQAHKAATPAEKIALYETAIREDAQLETAYYHLARLYRAEHDYEKSVLNYRKTLEVSHGSSRNRAILATDAGIACALLGKIDIAMQWWRKAIEYDPGYINPYFNLANTYEDQDQFPEAEQYFLRAQQLAPDDFRTFFNLARIYSKLGVWDKALTQYRHQLRTEDGDPWCHSDVATCYLNLGDISNARHHLEKTLSLDPAGEAGQYAQLILSGLG